MIFIKTVLNLRKPTSQRLFPEPQFENRKLGLKIETKVNHFTDLLTDPEHIVLTNRTIQNKGSKV